jgi:hypothetical protein
MDLGEGIECRLGERPNARLLIGEHRTDGRRRSRRGELGCGERRGVGRSRCRRRLRRGDGRPFEARNRLMRFAESRERVIEVEPKARGIWGRPRGHRCGDGIRRGGRGCVGIIHGIVSDARRTRVERIIHRSFIGAASSELEPLHTERADSPGQIQTGRRPGTLAGDGRQSSPSPALALRCSSSTTATSASVVVSPRLRPSATSRRSRRMILPERVLGRSGVM